MSFIRSMQLQDEPNTNLKSDNEESFASVKRRLQRISNVEESFENVRVFYKDFDVFCDKHRQNAKISFCQKKNILNISKDVQKNIWQRFQNYNSL